MNTNITPSMMTTTMDLTPAPIPGAVALDEISDLVALEQFLRDTKDEAEKNLKLVQDRIQALIGFAEEATVKGQRVFTWRYIDRMNETAFRKEHPTTAAVYTRTVPVDKLDVDLLRQAQPDLFREFQVRQFKRVQ